MSVAAAVDQAIGKVMTAYEELNQAADLDGMPSCARDLLLEMKFDLDWLRERLASIEPELPEADRSSDEESEMSEEETETRVLPTGDWLVLIHNPDRPGSSYGHFRCPECDSQFFWGGPSVHDGKCSRASGGYEGLEYWIGDAEIRKCVAGTGGMSPCDGAMVRRQLLEHVVRLEDETKP